MRGNILRKLALISLPVACLIVSFPFAQGPTDPVISIQLVQPEFTRVDKNRIYWRPVQNAETYRLQWRANKRGRWSEQYISADKTNYRFTEILVDVKYFVRVQA